MKLTSIPSSRKVWFAFAIMDFSEGFLGESKNGYPTIPAIEVTIPHLYSS
jgi:hypothetical protein